MKITPYWINWAFFIIGMGGVWVLTHDYLLLFFAWLASVHFTITVKGTESR